MEPHTHSKKDVETEEKFELIEFKFKEMDMAWILWSKTGHRRNNMNMFLLIVAL